MKTIKSKITERELIDFKKRRYARIKVQNAIKSGKLVRAEKCNLCFENCFVEAHHVDYGQPYSVMWLCASCHGKAHRKNSKYNPANNPQSPMPFIAEKNQTVTVSFTMPLKNFLALQKKSDNSKTPIAKILRDEIVKKFPVVDEQLDLFDGVNFDKSHEMQHERIFRMESDKKLLLQSEQPFIPEIRRQGNLHVGQLEGKLLSIFNRHGTDTGTMQRHKAN
jgi:hypothetical protein